MNAPSRRERWKVRVLKTPSLSHGTRLFLVHVLARHMKADGFVSRPRWKLANEAGVSERQVTRYLSNAVNLGWLVVVQPGYRSMTAEYQATFPSPESGTQDVSHSEPEKGDANGPSMGVTNTSRFHGGKRDVGRPTTSSSTTRPAVVVSTHQRNLGRSPASPSMRLGFGICNRNATAQPHCRTQARTVERHRPRTMDAAPVEIHPSGTDPATRSGFCPTRPRRKAQR